MIALPDLAWRAELAPVPDAGPAPGSASLQMCLLLLLLRSCFSLGGYLSAGPAMGEKIRGQGLEILGEALKGLQLVAGGEGKWLSAFSCSSWFSLSDVSCCLRNA